MGDRAGLDGYTVGVFYATVDDLTGYAASQSSPSFRVTNQIFFNASREVPVGSDNRPQNVYVHYIIKY